MKWAALNGDHDHANRGNSGQTRRVLVFTASVYYPAALMAIDFNQWFPTGSLVNSSTPRTWLEQIDWVYHAKDTLLTTAQVESNVASYRAQGIVRLNTVF